MVSRDRDGLGLWDDSEHTRGPIDIWYRRILRYIGGDYAYYGSGDFPVCLGYGGPLELLVATHSKAG